MIHKIPADVMARTAAFLLLKDSRASYAIENEAPAHKRIERWGKVIGQGGANPIDLDELVRLQQIVIGDTRFVTPCAGGKRLQASRAGLPGLSRYS